MALEKIINTDSLSFGKDKINKIMDTFNLGNISLENVNFVNIGKNLSDNNNYTLGKALDSEGKIIDFAGYMTSPFITVSANTPYTQNFSFLHCYFDANKKFLKSYAHASPFAPRTTVSPNDAMYVQITIPQSYKDKFQFERGTTSTSYEPCKIVYSGLGDVVGQIEALKSGKEYPLECFSVYNPNARMTDASREIFKAFRYAKITGSNADMYHCLRTIARNHSTNKYRFIIERLNGNTWERCIDTDAISVNEDSNGLTLVKWSNATYSIEFVIDYRLIPDGFFGSFHETGAVPYYVFNRDALLASGGGSGEAYDQSLNTSNTVKFQAVNTDALSVTGTMPKGTLQVPPSGLVSGDVWADTTDSATNPILRIML